MVAPSRRGGSAVQDKTALRPADRKAAPKAPGKAPTPTAPPAPKAPGKAPAGRAPGGAPALPRADSPPTAAGASVGRGKRGRQAASEGTAAPAGKAPTPSPTTVDAPTGRGKGGRRAAGEEAAPRAKKDLLHANFARDTALQYEAIAKKSRKSSVKLAAYRSARSVGEFFGLLPGPTTTALKKLALDLFKGLCCTPGFVAPRLLKSAFSPLRGRSSTVRLEQIGRASYRERVYGEV